jgi:hypothetical protein
MKTFAARVTIRYTRRMFIRLTVTLLILSGLTLAGCRSQRNQSPETAPTVASLDALATALPLTQNAPPTPWNLEQTRFARIEDGLNTLPGAQYTVLLQFDGAVVGTGQTVSASAQADVTLDQLTSARRVLLTNQGELIGQPENSQFEAVKLGDDAYLLRDGVCLSGGGEDARAAAALSAGDLIGGVLHTLPAGRQAVINGETVYAYTVTPEELRLPAVQLGDDSRVTVDSAELWIAPERGVVVRFYANLRVENVTLLGRPAPVTGTLILRYDTSALGEPNNISIPFGC